MLHNFVDAIRLQLLHLHLLISPQRGHLLMKCGVFTISASSVPPLESPLNPLTDEGRVDILLSPEYIGAPAPNESSSIVINSSNVMYVFIK